MRAVCRKLKRFDSFNEDLFLTPAVDENRFADRSPVVLCVFCIDLSTLISSQISESMNSFDSISFGCRRLLFPVFLFL